MKPWFGRAFVVLQFVGLIFFVPQISKPLELSDGTIRAEECHRRPHMKHANTPTHGPLARIIYPCKLTWQPFAFTYTRSKMTVPSARYGGNSSLLGHMVKDVRAAVDFMTCRSVLRSDPTMCSQHGYSVSNTPIDRIP
jgi:hypothetical protein